MWYGVELPIACLQGHAMPLENGSPRIFRLVIRHATSTYLSAIVPQTLVMGDTGRIIIWRCMATSAAVRVTNVCCIAFDGISTSVYDLSSERCSEHCRPDLSRASMRESVPRNAGLAQ